MSPTPHQPSNEPNDIASSQSPSPSLPALPNSIRPQQILLCGQPIHISLQPSVREALPEQLRSGTGGSAQSLLDAIYEVEGFVTPESFRGNLSAVLSFAAGADKLKQQLGASGYAHARASVIAANNQVADSVAWYSPFIGSAEEASDLIVGAIAAVLASTCTSPSKESRELGHDLLERISTAAGMISRMGGAAPGISALAQRKLEDLALYNPPFRPAISKLLPSWGAWSDAAEARLREATGLLVNSQPGFVDEWDQDRELEAEELRNSLTAAMQLIMSPLNQEARELPFSGILSAAAGAENLSVEATLCSGELLESQYGRFFFSLLAELSELGFRRAALDSQSFVSRSVLDVCEDIGAPETLETLGAKVLAYLNGTASPRAGTLLEHLDLPSHKLTQDARLWLCAMNTLRSEAQRLGIAFCAITDLDPGPQPAKTLILHRSRHTVADGQPAVRLLPLDFAGVSDGDILLAAAARGAVMQAGLGEKLAIGVNKAAADRIFSMSPRADLCATIDSDALRAYLSRSDVVLSVFVDPGE